MTTHVSYDPDTDSYEVTCDEAGCENWFDAGIDTGEEADHGADHHDDWHAAEAERLAAHGW